METVAVESSSPAPGVWRLRCGSVPEPTLLGYTGVAPRLASLEEMGEGAAFVRPVDVTAYRSSQRLVISTPLTPTEKLYGLGLQYRTIEHRGQLFELRVDHYKGRDDGRTHAPIPFFVSSRGYGIFVNSAARMLVYAGLTHRRERHPEIRSRRDPEWQPVAVSEIVEIALADSGAEVLIFAGPAPMDVIRRFNLYCGGGCLPPKWGLGFWHRTPLAYAAADVEREVDEFDEHGVPLDVIGLEPGWHSSSYPTTCDWHTDAFPDPEAMLQGLLARGVRTNLWENCFIHPHCDLGQTLEHLSGSHTGSWGGYCPDLSLDEARGAIEEHHSERHTSIGVSGYKLDECDDDQWLFPDHAEFPSGITGERLHQVYGTLIQRTTVEMFRNAGRRTYGLSRATNAGTVSFPYVIYNDCYDHREYITGLCSGSLSGVLFTPEARDAKTPEEWLRRVQATCFSPLAQLNAWASGAKPWDHPEVADEVKRVILLRTRLLPYIYTAFADYRERGIPPFRAMILEGGIGESSSSLAAVSDQYMIGPNLLVAPLFAGEPSRTVELPPGEWFDFYTGTIAGAAEQIEIPGSRDSIPLFVRDGGIIPMLAGDCLRIPAGEATTPIEVRHYGRLEGVFELYDDDGETYDFERGDWCRWTLRADRDTRGELSGVVEERRGPYISGYRDFSWRFMTHT